MTSVFLPPPRGGAADYCPAHDSTNSAAGLFYEDSDPNFMAHLAALPPAPPAPHDEVDGLFYDDDDDDLCAPPITPVPSVARGARPGAGVAGGSAA